MNENDWLEWKQHVLAELKRSNESHVSIAGTLTGIQIEITTLKVKSSLWGSMAGFIAGAIAGCIPVTIPFIIEALKK